MSQRIVERLKQFKDRNIEILAFVGDNTTIGGRICHVGEDYVDIENNKESDNPICIPIVSIKTLRMKTY